MLHLGTNFSPFEVWQQIIQRLYSNFNQSPILQIIAKAQNFCFTLSNESTTYTVTNSALNMTLPAHQVLALKVVQTLPIVAKVIFT